MSDHEMHLDLASVRAKLQEEGRKRFWRSIEEVAETPEFVESLHNEFPKAAAKPAGKGISRRDALKVVAASGVLAGLTACTKLPLEKIVPYVHPPEEFVPGEPLYYATSMPFGGVATGLLVESYMGRPTKVEGNPDHPGSLGATDIFSQCAPMTLYDPDRSQVTIYNGRISSWSDFLETVIKMRSDYAATKGAGLRILTESVISPSLGNQMAELLKQFPKAKWHQYEPAGRDSVREGGRLAYGEYVNTYYRFDQADVIVALDSDFLCSGGASVRYSHDFANRRRVTGPASTMNRLYSVEGTATNTGSTADHRLPLRSSEVEGFARALAASLGVKTTSPGYLQASSVPSDWVPGIARDLQKHRGSSVVIAGDHQPAVVHALAHAMNQVLGNVGKTVIYTDPVEVNPVNQLESLEELVADIKAGQVDTLIMMGGNPAYDAPVDLEFSKYLGEVKQRIRLGLYFDETAWLCNWHIPAAHFLESWGDGRAYDGTVSLIQPLIAPLYDGKTAHEVLAALLGRPGETPHETVRGYWLQQNTGTDFERFWEASLEKGIMPGSALPPKKVTLKPDFDPGAFTSPPSGPAQVEICLRPDPCVWDGSFTNNGWLQELPKPVTSLTWDNAALVGPATAQRLHLNKDDVIKVSYQGRSVDAPVWIVPGQAADSMTLHLGYGRQRAGHVGNGRGFNAYQIRTSGRPSFMFVDLPQKTGQRYHLVTMQNRQIIKQGGEDVEVESQADFNRDLMRVATLEEFRANPNFAKSPPEQTTEALSLYPPYNYKVGYQWGMSIDLTSCVGCNACIVACGSENNIAVVGKEQVDNGRIMHWIRLDAYFRGDLDNPETYNQVVPCMMCENAPCEYVCPVGATLHDPEGLNLMIYNRCIGTRYCSNNCPFKVRRFNFELFSDWTTPSLKLLRNPEVTVRSRGVMEKCTYCVQRIKVAEIKTQEENRQIRDLEVQTACQQVCPTQAIVFGNINDPNSRVSKLKKQSRQYGMLEELNIRPRTTYLARLRNPNPEIKE